MFKMQLYHLDLLSLIFAVIRYISKERGTTLFFMLLELAEENHPFPGCKPFSTAASMSFITVVTP